MTPSGMIPLVFSMGKKAEKNQWQGGTAIDTSQFGYGESHTGTRKLPPTANTMNPPWGPQN